MLKHERITPEWLAGFFDGEGCIGVYLKDGFPSLTVTLTQKDPEILGHILAKFPKATWNKRERGNALVWTGVSCKPILEYIESFVVCKYEQLVLGLEYCDLIIKVGQKLSIEAKTRKFEIMDNLKSLKHG